ncbi:hypothetical protein EV1_013173 [Malus domestica]
MTPASGRKTLFLGPPLSGLRPISPRFGHGRRLLKAGAILQLHMQLQRWSFESSALDSTSLRSSDRSIFIRLNWLVLMHYVVFPWLV